MKYVRESNEFKYTRGKSRAKEKTVGCVAEKTLGNTLKNLKTFPELIITT